MRTLHYRGCAIAFGTRHGKEHAVGPAFADILGARVTAPPDLDTDQFGTFTGDVTRTLTPLDAARAKARLAMRATGIHRALASEASYGPLRGVGLTGHEEILLFLDDTLGIEIIEGHRSLSTPARSRRATSYTDLAPTLAELGWPAQGLVVRPATGGTRDDIVKGITDAARLAAAITTSARRSADDHALIEPDLRANHNPTRQAVLTQLGVTLATRLARACPQCATPGYGRIDTERGLPCQHCGTPTDLVRADVHGCAHCPHRHTHPRPVTAAAPRWCPHCNP